MFHMHAESEIYQNSHIFRDERIAVRKIILGKIL